MNQYLSTALPWIMAVWVVGVCVLSFRLLLGITGAYRWRWGIPPLSADLQRVPAKLGERLGLANFARVFISKLAAGSAVAVEHDNITAKEVVARYWRFAQRYYVRHDGQAQIGHDATLFKKITLGVTVSDHHRKSLSRT